LWRVYSELVFMTGIYLFSDQNSTSFIHFNYFRQAYFRTFLTHFYQNLWKHGHVSRRNRYRNDAIKDIDTLNSESWCWITHVAPLESWLSKVALNRWYNDIFRPTHWFQMLVWPLGHGWWILDVEWWAIVSDVGEKNRKNQPHILKANYCFPRVGWL